jgi:hypothetical protein
MKTIGILGASSLLGETLFLESFLKYSGSINLLEHRTSLSSCSISYSVYTDPSSFFCDSDLVLSFIPIWEFVDVILSYRSSITGIQKIVAISSTSALTKLDSPNPWEKEYARRFLESEDTLNDICRELSIGLAILRPTMIWGECRDLNITFIQRYISRLGFFILPSRGNGLRWPIHHHDLFSIAYSLLHSESCGTFIVRGREELSYRDMVLKVFSWQHLDPVLFVLPRYLLSFFASTARVLTSKPYINSESFRRIDLTESRIAEAHNVLLSDGDFQPRSSSDVMQPSFLSRSINYIFSMLLCACSISNRKR